jgi:hydroxymethylbilane synthase
MGQASLGIEIVSSNKLAREIALELNDTDTYLCSKLERDFVAEIGAGCSAPVAINATIKNNKVTLKAMIGYPDGTNILEEESISLVKESNSLGIDLANKMISNGAKDILAKAEEIAFKDEMPQRL